MNCLNNELEDLYLDYLQTYKFDFIFKGFQCLDDDEIEGELTPVIKEFAKAIEKFAIKKQFFVPKTALCSEYKNKRFSICKLNLGASIVFKEPLWEIEFEDGYKNYWASANEIFDLDLSKSIN